MALWNVIRLLYGLCLYLIIQLHEKTFSYTFATTEVPITWMYVKLNIPENWAESPLPLFSAFLSETRPYSTCGIPMVLIIQICTQIPPIQKYSLGYKFCQLFKILTYREVQDTVSRYRWKPYRQPYDNTH